MNAKFTRMPLDWDLLRREGNNWLRYWGYEYSRSRKVIEREAFNHSNASHLL